MLGPTAADRLCKWAGVLTIAMTGHLRAQWQELHPYVDYPGTGQPSQGGTLMVSSGIGVHIVNVFYTPSAGGEYLFYRTDNDWESESTFLFGSGPGPGRMASGMVRAGLDRIYYQYSNQGIYDVRWIDDVTGLASPGESGNYYSGPVVLAAVHDTLCFAAYTRADGPMFVIRVGNGVSTIRDTVAQDYWYPRHLDFIDAQVGAMVIVRPNDRSKVLTTQDGGLTWSEALVDTADRSFCVEWSDDSTLWVAGDAGSLRRSVDRGASWDLVPLTCSGRLTAMDSYSSDSLWVGGSDGAIMVTGNGGLTWEPRPVNGMMVTRIQLFDGVAYAYTKDPDEPSNEYLHRWRATSPDMTQVGTVSWWSYSDGGIRLRPDEAETIMRLTIFDVSGRAVDPGINGSDVDLRALPAGLYLVTFVSNRRQETGKILWLPKDP